MIIVIILILCTMLILGKYWLIGVGLGIIFSIYYMVSEKVKKDKIYNEEADRKKAFELAKQGVPLPEKYLREIINERLARERKRRETPKL